MSEGGGRFRAVREFLYGMFAYEHVQEARERHARLESLFLLVIFGDMVGLPVLPPYYALRLLPHTLGALPGWKRRVLRERQFGEDHEHHLHGV
ncbi:MAG TPA: hypothetical protein VL084_00795 [Thermoanaerobaculia bacterium]|nr:hypothetical protein [Thermoanaerobaculia bacterium]